MTTVFDPCFNKFITTEEEERLWTFSGYCFITYLGHAFTYHNDLERLDVGDAPP